MRPETSRRALSLWITTARALAALVGIAVPLLLVRVFDQTTFGYYKELFLIAGTAVPLLCLGVPASVFYLGPRHTAQGPRLLVQSAALLGLSGISGAGALLLFAGGLQHFFHAPLARYVPWLAAFVALAVPAALLPVAAIVDRRSRLAALIVTGSGLLYAAALMLAAWLTADLGAVMTAACGVMLLEVVALVAYLVWRASSSRGAPVVPLVRAQLAYALPFAAAALVGLLRDRLHAFYVGSTMTAGQFAVYAVGLIQIPVLDHVTQTVGEVVVLENTGHYSAGHVAEARATWQRAAVALATLIFPVFAIGEVFAPEAIAVLFGPAYGGAVPVLRINLLLLPLEVLLASPLLRATADVRMMVGADLASLAVAMITLVPLAHAFGPAGAVASLVAGFATFSLVASLRNAARLELRLVRFLPWGELAKLLAVAAGTVCIARLMVSAAAPVWRVVAGPAIVLALYGIIVWRSGLLPAADRTWVRELLRRVRSRYARG
ncbi:MAG TPA: hypothetical protein VLT79_01080 [Gemmatimonadales bacterium]|nr:hypothetical protein [Gemmatimonadales bacterium]